MTFETFAAGQWALLGITFVLALAMGAVVNKTNFCTMGAVSDWVNIGDLGRMRAWFLAIGLAIVGVTLLEATGLVKAGASFPPYRMGQLLWAENLLGGFIFGIGMTLASGCGNKCLIRIGGGNVKSILVLAIIAVIAYYMINPFPGTDATLMSVLFYDWLRPLAIGLGKAQDLGTLASADNTVSARVIIALLLGGAVLWWVLRSHEFRSSLDNVLGGIVVGLAVVLAWVVSSNVVVTSGGDSYSLADYAQQWDFLADSSEGKPADTRALSPQSFTFINPMGQTLGYAMSGFKATFLTFGVVALVGIILGSMLWAILSRSFRIEWFANGKDFATHVIGAALMGFGGVLGMGCTIGQGVTGVSTLALGSFITLAAIILGSALTMKVQLYKMVYEDASFFAALVTGLADLRLVPTRFRKLDAV